MKKAEQTASPGRVLVMPALCGLIVTLVLMLVGAWTVSSGRLNSSMIPLAAALCVAAGAFLSALLASRLAGRSRFLWGLAGGGVLFGLLLIISFLWVGQPVRLVRVAIVGAAVLALSCLGSILGASVRRKKHRKK